MFAVLWQCVRFFWCPCFLCLKCVRMCVLCIVSTTVYAVFNCVCIIRSTVCSVYVSYAAEARGRRMLAANYNRGAAFGLFIIFVISFCLSLLIWQIPCYFYIEVLVALASVSLWFASLWGPQHLLFCTTGTALP